MEEASADLVAAYLAAGQPDEAKLEVGASAHLGAGVPAFLRASGFNRHSFLCGQSGSGKTYSSSARASRFPVPRT